MSLKNYEEILRMRQERSCGNCKFFDGCCCMYKCALRAILHWDETAKKCEHFELGDYNEDALEESNYE